MFATKVTFVSLVSVCRLFVMSSHCFNLWFILKISCEISRYMCAVFHKPLSIITFEGGAVAWVSESSRRDSILQVSFFLNVASAKKQEGFHTPLTWLHSFSVWNAASLMLTHWLAECIHSELQRVCVLRSECQRLNDGGVGWHCKVVCRFMSAELAASSCWSDVMASGQV